MPPVGGGLTNLRDRLLCLLQTTLGPSVCLWLSVSVLVVGLLLRQTVLFFLEGACLLAL
jgi:hypothetical protein